MENIDQWLSAAHLQKKKKITHWNIIDSLSDPLSQACGNTDANVYFKDHDLQRVLSIPPLKKELRGFWEGIALLYSTAVQEDKSNILWWINAVSLILSSLPLLS